MYNKRENITEIRKTEQRIEWYRKRIVEMVGQIENLDYLEFMYNMMMAFKEKWGI